VPFVEKMVDQDYDAALEMIKLSGQQGVPVIAADGDVILGFDQAKLKRLAEKYGAAKRPPLGVLGANAEEYLERHPEVAANAPAGIKGVYVGKIRPDTVAERAGLKPGDIVTGLAGKRVRSMADLDRMIDALNAGDKATVRYVRNKEEHSAQLQF
jgi:S1-C subfamily serine protease